MSIFGKKQIITFILCASLFALILSPVHSAANSLTLAWDPNTEDDLAGYNVYYGTQTGDYNFVLDVGDTTQYTVTDLNPETQYYFALTAYDTSSNESDFSAEVSAITTNEGLGVDFGSIGLWEHDGSNWTRLTPSDPQYLAVCNSKLVGDFGGIGLWEFDGISWTKLTTADGDNSGNCMVAYGTTLIVDFGTLGLWQYNGGLWSKLTPSDPEYLGVYDGKLVGDFGGIGLWEFDGISWTKLTSSDADNSSNCMVTVDSY